MKVLEIIYAVGSESSAKALGSGDLQVLGTPAIIAFTENCCQELAKGLLKVGETTVGIEIQLSHLKASKIGGSVRVRAQLSEQTNHVLTFVVQVFENQTLLAEGKHRRAIVDITRFMSKIE